MVNENLINIREFTDDERIEISHIIKNNVEMTILQRIFPLTENPIEKGDIFCICYRLLNTAKNLVKTKESGEKLDKLLTSVKDIYIQLYSLYIREKNVIELGKKRIHNHIITILSNYSNCNKVNNLIDIFLILAQKFELLDINKIVALDIETEEGKEIEKDILSEENL